MSVLDGITFPVETGRQISVVIIEETHAKDLISKEELAQERGEKCSLIKTKDDNIYELNIKDESKPTNNNSGISNSLKRPIEQSIF